MGAYDRGNNGGISGTLIGITGGPTFQNLVVAWEVGQGVESMPVPGRGDSDAFVPSIPVRPGGSFVVKGRAQFDQPPTPSSFQGHTGTVVETFHIRDGTPAQYSTPVRVDRATFALAKDAKDGWDVVLSGQVTGFPTISGFAASAPSGQSPAALEKELFAGLTKTHDPKNLTDSAQRMFIVRPLTNSDAAELSQLGDLISEAVAPFTGAKARFARLEPSRAYDFGIFTVAFAHRTTEDDVEMDGTSYTVDASSLTDTTSVTVVEADSTPDGGVSVSGHVLRDTSKRQLHDSKWAITYHFARRTHEQDVTFPGTITITDPNTLVDSATVTLVNSSSTYPAALDTPPTGLKVRRISSEQLTDAGKYRHTAEYGRTDTAEDVINPATATSVDPSGLQTGGTVAAINDSTPTIPTVSGQTLVERATTVRELNDDNDLYVTEFGQRSTEDDVEMPGTGFDADPTDLTSTAQETFVFDAGGTEPEANDATVSLPADVVVVSEAIKPINRDKNQKVIRWGVRTAKNEIEWLRSRRTVDADAHVKDHALVVEVTTSSTPDATGNNPDSTNLSLYSSESHRLTTTQWVHVHEFRPFTSEEEAEEGINETVDDPAASLVGDDVRALLTTNATETAPSVSGRSVIRRRSKKVSKTEYLHTFWYGFRDNAAKLEADKTTTTTDPDDLESEAFTADVWSGSEPSDPAAPSGLKLDSKRDLTTDNPTYTLRVYHWRKTTSAERIVNQNTWTEEDPQDLESRQQVAAINATPSLDAGYVERSTRTQELNDDNELTIVEGGVRSTKQDIEYLQSKETADSGNLAKRSVVAKVTSSATPDPTGLNPDTTNLIQYTVETHRVTASQYVHIFRFEPLSAEQEMTAQFEGTQVDPASLEDEATRVLYNTTSTPDAAPSVSGRVHWRTTVRRVGQAKYRYVYEYRYRTTAEALEADKTETTTDVSGIESSAVTADVWLVSGGAPATPTLSGYVLRASTDVETGNPLYRCRVYRWGLTTVQQDIENGGSFYEFEQFDNIGHVDTTVLTTTDSLATLAAALRTTYKNDVTFDGGRLERLNANRVKQTLRFIDTFEMFEGRAYGGHELFETRFTGSAVQVYVSEIVEQAGFWEILIEPQKQWFAEMTFSLSKRRGTSTIPIHFEKLLPSTRNSDTFIGIPAGYVTYTGARPRTNRSVAAPHVMGAVFDFKFSSRGLYYHEGVRMGWLRTTDDMSSLTTGWKNVSTFGWSGGGLPTADYSDFLT